VEPRGRAGERERCLPLLEIEVAVREAELLDLPDHRHERGVERFGSRGLGKPGTGLELLRANSNMTTSPGRPSRGTMQAWRANQFSVSIPVR
jgi:hypothetical protein